MNFAIFCCHPEDDGLISESVIDVIRQLKTVSDRIVIVSNGAISRDSENALKEITQEIIERKNIGLDYGGYRHILTTYIGYEQLNKYDSLILCNDSFYGFFTSISQIFKEMTSAEYDIWGLNKVERGLLDHIQSYFMVFRQNTYKDLYRYFTENVVEDNDYGTIAAIIEPKMYRFFKQRGYRLGAWKNTERVDIYAYPDICIQKYNLPILKRKCFKEGACSSDKLNELVMWLESNKGYKKEYFPKIQAFSAGQQRIRLAEAAITEDELLSFANEGSFYIFGGGNIAKELYNTYFSGNRNFIKYVASEANGTNCLSIKELPNNARVIIAVKDISQNEVETLLPENCNYIKLWDI